MAGQPAALCTAVYPAISPVRRIRVSRPALGDRLIPLCATLGFRARVYRPDRIELVLDWQEGLCTSNGVLHGGAIMALTDSAAGVCAFLNLPQGAQATAVSRPLHAGSRTIVIETEVQADDGRLAAKTIQTQAVLGGRGTAR